MRHHPSELGLSTDAPQELAVRTLAAGDRAEAARWDAFVAGCNGATFFHRSGWRQVIGEVFRHRTHFLYAQRAGRIEGVLPLAHVRSFLFGNALVSLPFAVYGGVVAETTEAATALENEAQALGERLGVDRLELRNVAARHPDWPTQDLYVRFRKEILPDADANMLAIPRKQRAMVRKGIKAALRSEIDAPPDRFFALYADNVHRHGTPALPKRYFEALRRAFGDGLRGADGGRSRRAAALQRAELLFPRRGAALLCRRRHGGPRSRRQRLQVLGTDAPRLRARAQGIRLRPQQARAPDRTRSRRTGGSCPSRCTTSTGSGAANAVPQNNPMNPKYRALIALWRRLPLPRRERHRPASGAKPGMSDAGTPMEPLLFLAHRLPFPPNKGDKVRSFHFFKHLAGRYRVFLGTFVDDPADWEHIESVRELCAGIHVEALAPWTKRARAAAGVVTGEVDDPARASAAEG